MNFGFRAAPVLLALLPVVAVASAAESPAQARVCAACHGAAAPSPHAAVPTIHGLPQGVLENALYDFRATIRPCREVDCAGDAGCPASDCCSATAGLTDEDIAGLARWYASRPFVPAGEPWDAALGGALHAAQCRQCHDDGDAAAADAASVLRGQRKAYLLGAIEDFQLERRVAFAAMHAMLASFSDTEIVALLEFYASPRQH